jgi:diguanylate cyclase (GGDEF)-like protein
VVTVISRFRVSNGLEEEVRAAFLNRPRLVENAAGFRSLEVLTEAADPSVFLLLTRWADEESFRAWHRSEAHHQSHEGIPRGLRLDSSFTSLTVGNSIENPDGIQTLRDAISDYNLPLYEWLMESDTIFALLLAPDGAIRGRNRAGNRIFPPDPAKNGSDICDYLVASDVQQLRGRLSDAGGRDDGGLLLNRADGQHNPITLEAALIRCSGAVLLLGTEEHHYDAKFQTEILKLTNELSVMMRESVRKNRELQEANKKIERLACTDALTGLANRRTLHEALLREIARAERYDGSLSIVIADLDHFKSINDRHGHMTGDRFLARVAVVFEKQVRKYDLAARFGGEEFILLLPETSTDGAIVTAERVREGVAEIELPGCPRRLTVSLGVAAWRRGESPESLVDRADGALYAAKRAGRNRIEVASGGPA